MVIPAPNSLLWKFSEATPPDAWISTQARRVYERALENERNGAWIEHAVGGSVRIARRSQAFIKCVQLAPYGCGEDFARAFIEMHLQRLEEDIERARKSLDAYGGHIFIQPVESLLAPRHPFDAQARLLEIIRSKPVAFWVHGVKYEPDNSGTYRETSEREGYETHAGAN